MSRHLCFAALALCLVALPQTHALAQSGGIPKSAKESGNVQQSAGEIRAFVSEQITRLQDSTASEQHAARSALVEEIMVDGHPAQTSFLAAYCAEFAGQARPLFQSENMAVRLNAAIILAKLAERSQTQQLLEPTLAVLNDSADPVVLWGLKSAKAILPVVLGAPGLPKASELIPKVVDVAVRRQSGYVVQDAYDALTLDFLTNPKPISNPMLVTVTPAMLQVLNARAGKYKTVIPDEPMSENLATLFLTDGKVWSAQPADQQVAIVQSLLNLASSASQRIASATPGNQRNMVVRASQSTAKGLGVIGNRLGDKAWETAAQQVSQIIEATPAEEVKTRLSALATAIKANSKFAVVEEPASLPALQSPTPASTTPAR